DYQRNKDTVSSMMTILRTIQSTHFAYTTLFRSRCPARGGRHRGSGRTGRGGTAAPRSTVPAPRQTGPGIPASAAQPRRPGPGSRDRKSTRLNSSHVKISYAVCCLKKKLLIVKI